MGIKQMDMILKLRHSRAALCEYLGRANHEAYTIGSSQLSAYNTLYYLHLAYSIGKELDTAVDLLKDIAQTQDEFGFLTQNPGNYMAGVHDDTYIRFHKTALFFQLADTYDLDVRLPDLHALFSERMLRDYLSDLDYRNIWFHSNVLLGIATASHLRVRRGEDDIHRQILVEYLTQTEQKFHGLWGYGEGASLLNAMAGTFHLVPILLSVGIVPRFPVELAAKILSMQNPDGLFCGPSGYSCIEYDSIYLLRVIANYAHGIPSELCINIKAAATKATIGILGLQNPDGGFPEMGRVSSFMKASLNVFIPALYHRDPATLVWNAKKLIRSSFLKSKPIYNNSIRACGALPHQSNIFSSWLRYLALRMAEELSDSGSMRDVGTMALVGLNYFPPQFFPRESSSTVSSDLRIS